MSGKGGVGKTSLFINIAHFCAHYGMKVLMVDCDLSTNGATTYLSMKTEQSVDGDGVETFRSILRDLRNKKMGIGSVIPNEYKPLRIEPNFYFIPIFSKNDDAEKEELKERTLEEIAPEFEKLISKWRKEYDLIILDLSAGYNYLNKFFIEKADDIGIVVEDNKLSFVASRSCVLEIIIDIRKIKKMFYCVNKWNSKNIAEGILIDTYKGFQDSKYYAEIFSHGQLIKLGVNDQTKEIMNIAKKIIKNPKTILDAFDAERQLFRQEKREERQRDINELEREKHQKFIQTRNMFLCFFGILIALAVVITVLKIWKKISWWVYILVGTVVLVVCCVLGKKIFDILEIRNKIYDKEIFKNE